MKTFLLLLIIIFNMPTFSFSDIKNQNEWNKFRTDFGGNNYIKWDKKTCCPKYITGNNIKLKIKKDDQRNIKEVCKQFIYKYQKLFNLKNSEIELKEILDYGDHYFLRYKQYYKKIEVYRSNFKNLFKLH